MLCGLTQTAAESLHIRGNTGGKLIVNDVVYVSKAKTKEKKNKWNLSVAVRGRLIATSVVATGGVRVMGQVDMPIQTARYTPSHTHMETFGCEHLALSI